MPGSNRSSLLSSLTPVFNIKLISKIHHLVLTNKNYIIKYVIIIPKNNAAKYIPVPTSVTKTPVLLPNMETLVGKILDIPS